MLKDAPIVILDEPTSAMDAHTERLVMDGVERLLRGRTGFIIAHRLSTVMTADLVAVLDGGRIVESGDPATLLGEPSTRFAGLARAQLMTEVPGASLAEPRVTIGPNDAGGVTHRSSAEHKRRRWRHTA
jgi:ABC-type multidrug transport system ATPase subunit